MAKPQRVEQRDCYRIFSDVTTRWKDNDVYGHINNAVYNTWMDTAVTSMFMDTWLDLKDAPIIPVAVETKFTFRAPIEHPAQVQTGLRVDRIGNRSVQCGTGVFQGSDDKASAWGHMIHVFIDRATNSAVPIPDACRNLFEDLRIKLQ